MAFWIIAIAFLLAPLGCWALLARTKVLGWTFAFVLAAYAVTEFFLVPGWLFGDRLGGGRLWLVLGLPVMSVVALVVGTKLENRDLGIPRMRSTRRSTAGVILSSLYGIGVVGAVGLIVLLIGLLPQRPDPASPDLVTPLGPGLTVVQQEPDCEGSDEEIPCTAEFQARSTSGLSGPALLQLVQDRLTRLHGWPSGLSQGMGCRVVSGHATCVSIARDHGGVQISVDKSTNADMPG